MGDIAEMHSDMYEMHIISCEREYKIAKQMTETDLVSFLINNKHKFHLLEREELVNSILHFHCQRGFLTRKQFHVLYIAYAEINSEELDF